MSERLGTQLQSGGLEQSIHTGLLGKGMFAGASLDLNFAVTKNIGPLVTFTRASSGTYVGSDGLIKTATTNLQRHSEDFTQGLTPNNATLTANQGIAPNGAITADQLLETTANGLHSQEIADHVFIAGAAYTFSCYAKSIGGRNFAPGFPTLFSSARFGFFNLSGSGSVVNTGAGVTASIQAVGDGWYRCSITSTCVTGGGARVGVFIASETSISYVGDAAKGLLLWGAQLEQSSTVGEYIPTTSTINSAPRFDHNPTTGESLGLLVEEQRTNLIVQSENLGTTWSTTGLLAFGSGSTLNATVAPDGATTADLVTENLSTSEHRIETAAISWAANTTYTLTVFAKANGRTRMDFFGIGGGNFTGGREADFNLLTGSVISTDGSTASITPFPNGWYRLRMTFTTSAAPSASPVFIRLNDNSSNFSYTGDGTSGIFIWGAQLEAGAFASSYIPTTTAAATRSADVASITGTAFSSWYRQDEGTVFADVNSAPVNNVAQLAYDISEGVGNERMFQRRSGSGMISTAVVDNGVTQGDIGSVAISASARYRSGFAYKLNDLEIVVNGGGSATDTSATLPTPDRLHIGQNFASGQSCNGTLRRLTFWPARLASSTLSAITL